MPRTRIPPARRRRAVRCVAASQICTVNARRPSRALELALGLSWKICGCAQEGYRAARLCVCNTQKKPPAPQESPRRVEVAHTTQAVCFFGLSEPQIKLSAKVADGLRSISRKGHPRPLRRICCQYKKVAPGLVAAPRQRPVSQYSFGFSKPSLSSSRKRLPPNSKTQ